MTRSRVRNRRACAISTLRLSFSIRGTQSGECFHVLAAPERRIRIRDQALTAREALEMATLSGGRVLGRDEIGSLAPGMAADFVAFDLNQIGFSGTSTDLVAALVFCHPVNVNYSVINGRLVVDRGHLTTIDLPVIMERHNAVSKALINKTL